MSADSSGLEFILDPSERSVDTTKSQDELARYTLSQSLGMVEKMQHFLMGDEIMRQAAIFQLNQLVESAAIPDIERILELGFSTFPLMDSRTQIGFLNCVHRFCDRSSHEFAARSVIPSLLSLVDSVSMDQYPAIRDTVTVFAKSHLTSADRDLFANFPLVLQDVLTPTGKRLFFLSLVALLIEEELISGVQREHLLAMLPRFFDHVDYELHVEAWSQLRQLQGVLCQKTVLFSSVIESALNAAMDPSEDVKVTMAAVESLQQWFAYLDVDRKLFFFEALVVFGSLDRMERVVHFMSVNNPVVRKRILVAKLFGQFLDDFNQVKGKGSYLSIDAIDQIISFLEYCGNQGTSAFRLAFLYSLLPALKTLIIRRDSRIDGFLQKVGSIIKSTANTPIISEVPSNSDVPQRALDDNSLVLITIAKLLPHVVHLTRGVRASSTLELVQELYDSVLVCSRDHRPVLLECVLDTTKQFFSKGDYLVEPLHSRLTKMILKLQDLAMFWRERLAMLRMCRGLASQFCPSFVFPKLANIFFKHIKGSDAASSRTAQSEAVHGLASILKFAPTVQIKSAMQSRVLKYLGRSHRIHYRKLFIELCVHLIHEVSAQYFLEGLGLSNVGLLMGVDPSYEVRHHWLHNAAFDICAVITISAARGTLLDSSLAEQCFTVLKTISDSSIELAGSVGRFEYLVDNARLADTYFTFFSHVHDQTLHHIAVDSALHSLKTRLDSLAFHVFSDSRVALGHSKSSAILSGGSSGIPATRSRPSRPLSSTTPSSGAQHRRRKSDDIALLRPFKDRERRRRPLMSSQQQGTRPRSQSATDSSKKPRIPRSLSHVKAKVSTRRAPSRTTLR